MSSFVVTGGKKLKGAVKVAGNKNSTFGLMAASLLASSPTTLTNVPRIRDVHVSQEILESVGCKVTFVGNQMTIDPSRVSSFTIDPALGRRTRGSIVFLAPLFAKFGRVMLPKPGGDSIGERMLDTHLSLLGNFGAKVTRKDGGYLIKTNRIKPGKIFLEEASVTATEIGLIVAAVANGETIIEDAACEPHVQDLCEMLGKMGVAIDGVGTNTLVIAGAKKLGGVTHKVRPDHIEAGTFAIASAVTGGDVLIHDALEDDLKMTLIYLSGLGVSWNFPKKGILHVTPSKLVASRKKFQTRPWPGFPTDMMSQLIVLATQAEGTVICHDWMYEWRIFFVDHLISMGAGIIIADPHRVIINGPSTLSGEILPSNDIRAGGALVLAALAARGESIVEHAEIIDRGYENLEGRLRKLGAAIERVD